MPVNLEKLSDEKTYSQAGDKAQHNEPETARKASGERLAGEEWLRAYQEWIDSPAHRDIPALPPEAFDRESFYEDHD